MPLTLDKHTNFLISGGTGFIGTALCRALLDKGHSITLLTRQTHAATRQFRGQVRAISDTKELSSDTQLDAVINLAGAPVIGPPWTLNRRRVLLRSRMDTTENLLRFVRRADARPTLWLQASAIGYYGSDPATTASEESPAGLGFAAELCQQWEALAEEVDSLGIRRVTLRLGVIAGRSGGALPRMLLPYRFGMGGVIGPGHQHFSWLHLDDLLGLIAKALTDQSMQGVYNAVAPHCPTYRELADEAGKVLHRPVFIPMPAWLLNGLLGEMGTMLTGGPLVIPGRLLQQAYEFRFPGLHEALVDIS